VLGMGGHWMETVVGAEVGSSEITPLVHHLHSQSATEFAGEKEDLIDAVRKISS
jgi:hypothetical protein